MPGPVFFGPGDEASDRVMEYARLFNKLFTGNTQYLTFIKKTSVNVPTQGMANHYTVTIIIIIYMCVILLCSP